MPRLLHFCLASLEREFYPESKPTGAVLLPIYLKTIHPRKFSIAPGNRPGPKRKGLSPNHQFSGAILVFGSVLRTNHPM